MRSCYGRGRPLRAAIQTCCLAAFLFFGYDQGNFGGILQNPDWLETFDYPVSSLYHSHLLNICRY